MEDKSLQHYCSILGCRTGGEFYRPNLSLHEEDRICNQCLMLRSRVKSPAHLSLLCINVCETRNKIIKITFFKKSLQVFDFDSNSDDLDYPVGSLDQASTSSLYSAINSQKNIQQKGKHFIYNL